MKTMILLISFALICFVQTSVFGQWDEIIDFGDQYRLQNIEFTNQHTLFASGYNSDTDQACLFKISLYEDGSFSHVFEHNFAQAFYSIKDLQFVDESNGFLIAESNDDSYSIYRTTNGGENWELRFFGSAYQGFMMDRLFFLNTELGWTSSLNFFKTTDGGSNWYLTYCVNDESATDLFFTSPLTGYFVGDCNDLPAIYKTEDGGSTWNTLSHGVTTGYFSAIYFVDENTGFVTGSGDDLILKTTDAGNTWNVKWSGENIYCIDFSDNLYGWAGGSNGLVLKTSDGGESWNVHEDGLSNRKINDISVYTNQLVAAITDRGNVFVFSAEGSGNDPYLSVSPTSMDMPSSISTSEINIQSNVNWSIQNDLFEWILVDQMNGFGNSNLHVTCLDNGSSDARSGFFIVSSNAIAGEIVVVNQQASDGGQDPYLNINSQYFNAPFTPTAQTFWVSANVAWQVYSNDSWISVTPANGSNDGSFEILLSENTASNVRIGSVTVSSSNQSLNITVVQEGYSVVDPYLIVDQLHFSAPSQSVSQTINISSNVSWQAHSEVSWISVDANSGMNDGSFTMYLSENFYNESRMGMVVVSSNEMNPINITVFQEANLILDLQVFGNEPSPSEGYVNETVFTFEANVTGGNSYSINAEIVFIAPDNQVYIKPMTQSGSSYFFRQQTLMQTGTYYFYYRVSQENGQSVNSENFSIEVLNLSSYCRPIYSYPNEYHGFGGADNHVGCDYAAPEYTDVYSITDGYVIWAGQFGGFGSYNPTTDGGAIVIKHLDNDGQPFFGVYGHLYVDVNTNYTGQPGEFIARGQKIGSLNGFTTSGVYRPHLHFGIFDANWFPSNGWGYSNLADWVNPEIFLSESFGEPGTCSDGGWGYSDIETNTMNIKPIVFPNPTKDFIQIENAENFKNLIVYSLLGDRLGSFEINNGGRINLESLSPGTYILEFIDPFNAKTRIKIIVL